MFKFIIFFMLTCGFVYGSDHSLNDLKFFADGLNVEGGIPAQNLTKKQIWADLSLVLDRPFEDGVDLNEITETNSYPLKESSISSYNEAQANLTYLTVMHYYITHARKIAKKSQDDLVKMTVQVHRNGSGLPHLHLLEKLLLRAVPEFKGVKMDKGSEKNAAFTYLYPDYNTIVEYRYGYTPETINNYQQQDIVLSISLNSGFNPLWPSGTLLIPFQFIPLDLETMNMNKNESYHVRNHLLEVLPDLIDSQNPAFVEIINDHFLSPNDAKKGLLASSLKYEDFHPATLLQANGLFNPKALPNEFHLIMK